MDEDFDHDEFGRYIAYMSDALARTPEWRTRSRSILALMGIDVEELERQHRDNEEHTQTSVLALPAYEPTLDERSESVGEEAQQWLQMLSVPFPVESSPRNDALKEMAATKLYRMVMHSSLTPTEIGAFSACMPAIREVLRPINRGFGPHPPATELHVIMTTRTSSSVSARFTAFVLGNLQELLNPWASIEFYADDKLTVWSVPAMIEHNGPNHAAVGALIYFLRDSYQQIPDKIGLAIEAVGLVKDLCKTEDPLKALDRIRHSITSGIA